MKKNKCVGCSENFYNGFNPYGIKECWGLKSAKMVKRKKVGINDVPPWTMKASMYPSCYRQKGYVFIDCSKEDRQH